MKFRRRGVKREHSVLGPFAAVFERLAALPGVEGVVPGRIANNPTHHPGLILKTETATGYKLLAKTTTSIQEVFVIARAADREHVLQLLRGMATRALAPATSPARTRGPRRGGRGRAHPPTRPAVLPAARWQGNLVRYTATGSRARPGWAPAGASVADSAAASMRHRLQVLRLRRSRWLRRFGVPERRAPLPPRAHPDEAGGR